MLRSTSGAVAAAVRAYVELLEREGEAGTR